MSKPATMISSGWIQELYTQRTSAIPNPTLQILAYQISEFNPKQIMLRISDSQSFVDCYLVGPYSVTNSKIISTEYARANQSFKRNDLVKMTDFFYKVDVNKMCELKIIIRKIEEVSGSSQVLGKPQEISQYVENSQARVVKAVNMIDPSKLINCGSSETPIKIEEGEDQVNYHIGQNINHSNVVTQPQPMRQQTQQKQEQSLTLADIMSNKQGFFIGRLVRMKFGCKDAKDGPMSFLYLGLLDTNGELVRIHLAGRMAIKQSKQLKKGRCYYFKGLELFSGEKTKCGPQIRLKDKQYKIHQIQNQAIKSQYKHEYYKWQHENQWVDIEMVDVIGIIQDIEQKTSYKNVNSFREQRQVVRLVIRNTFKTVKISFWADHINMLQSFQLQRKKAIVIQDIKKKKNIFLDFISQSNIILLDDDSQLKQKLSIYLPPLQQAPDPNNIKQLIEVSQIEPYSSKLRMLELKILSVNHKWVIYKLCNVCKKKVERVLESCLECSKSQFCYKYNCAIELFDDTGNLNCVAFDPVCEKMFGLNALQFSQIAEEEEVKHKCEQLMGILYKFSIEHKNNRYILRSIEKVKEMEEEIGQSPQNASYQ